MTFKRNFTIYASISIFILSAFFQTALSQTSGSLSISTNPDGALVTLSGNTIVSGVTPTVFRQTLIGFYKITIERYGYARYTTKVILDPSKQMELHIKLTPKTRFKSAIRSMVIPGWGQRYSNQKFKGLFYTFFAAATAFGYYKADDDFDTKYDRFIALDDEYNALSQNGNVNDLEELLPRLTNAKDRAYDAENMRRIAIGSVIAVWSLSVIDALFFFPEEKGTFKVKNVTLTPSTSSQNVGLNLSYHV